MNLNDYANQCYTDNAVWWYDADGNKLERDKAVLLCLIHSEVSEVLEGVRKDKMDDHIKEMKAEVVEMADVLIRVFDYCGAYGLDIQSAYDAKKAYNKVRSDHTHAARNAVGGKKF
jgi:NTP pyrophosphatase (non-canonical NTP hydrolase)